MGPHRRLLKFKLIDLLWRMTEAMAAAGADVAVVVTPSYYKGQSRLARLSHRQNLLQVE